jgi:4-amino-4-deoxy-L-arabinose transferase-like glycosyltransferase
LSATGRRDWRRIAYPLLLLVLCLVLYLWRLGATPLEDFDEAYYAVGAREMLQRHDLGTPYFNGHPFLLKPILIYWVIAGAFTVLGTTEFAARVASAFLGAFTVLITYWFVAHTVNRRAGLVAGLSLALCYMWIDISRDASIDALLTALLTSALFLFFLGMQAPLRQGRWLYLCCYPLLGLALLAKGPVPTGVVVLGLLTFVATSGRLRRTLLQAKVLPGLAIALAVAGPWYWYELCHQPGFFATFFIGEHFGHIGGTLARREPVWGNLKYLLIYFYPWVAFLPGALWYAFRQPRDHVLRFACWWSVAVVVLFSIPRSKLAHYLAPAFPPLAIVVGAWLDAYMERRPAPRWPTGVAVAILGLIGVPCLLLGAAAAFPAGFVTEWIAERWGAWRPGLSPVVILASVGIGSCAAILLARRRRALAPALALTMLVAGFVYAGWFKPRLAQIQAEPRKELAQLASRLLPASEPLGVYYAKRNSTIFYLRRPIVDLGETEREFVGVLAFLSAARPAAVLTHARFLADLERRGIHFSVVGRRGDYVLIANHCYSAK